MSIQALTDGELHELRHVAEAAHNNLKEAQADIHQLVPGTDPFNRIF